MQLSSSSDLIFSKRGITTHPSVLMTQLRGEIMDFIESEWEYVCYLFIHPFVCSLFHLLFPITLFGQRTRRDRRFHSTSLDKETGIAKGATQCTHADSREQTTSFLFKICNWFEGGWESVMCELKQRGQILVSPSGSNMNCALVSFEFFWATHLSDLNSTTCKMGTARSLWASSKDQGKCHFESLCLHRRRHLMTVSTYKSLLKMEDPKPATPRAWRYSALSAVAKIKWAKDCDSLSTIAEYYLHALCSILSSSQDTDVFTSQGHTSSATISKFTDG